jgi:PKD repeat protein
MFDPSKLDLDLDNNNKKHENWSLEKNESEKISQNKLDSKNIQVESISTWKDDLEVLLEESPSLKISENTTELTSEASEKDVLKEIEIDTWLWEINIEEPWKVNNYGTSSDNFYDKQNIIDSQKNEEQEIQEEKQKIIFDINIKSLQDIFNKIIENQYDFVTIEPFDDAVKIIYRKDKVEKEILYIKYPTYTQILIKWKTLTKLKVDDVESSQEWTWIILLQSKTYKVLSKTAPGWYGEKIFLKLQEENTQKKKIEKKPISFMQILGFLGAALFAALVIGWGFLTFVLLNSNTVSDLAFFNNLGVDVGSIRDFTSKLVDSIFFVIILIETLFLFSFTFKAILTKKELKKQKIARSIFAFFFLILTFISGFVWITLSNKINDLKGQNYGKMLTYDNSKYLSNIFDEQWSIVDIEKSLIWPVTLRFDISEIINQLVTDNNYNPQKITWIFWKDEENAPINDLETIRTFDQPWLNIVKLRIDYLNSLWEEDSLEQIVAEINIDHVVEINEKKVAGGWTIYQLDASSLQKLGKIEWYKIPDLNNLSETDKTKTISRSLKQPASKGYLYDSKILYDEELILAIKILTWWEEQEELDKIFVFTWENSWDDVSANIIAEASINNAFKYNLYVSDLETITWNGTIESFLWKIEDKTIKKEINLSDVENSSMIEHEFPSYGTFKVYLDILDSRGNTQTIEKEIIIEKKLTLSKSVIVRNNNESIANLEYNQNLHEYVIDEIWAPTTISLDARFIKSQDPNYVSRKIEWDFESDNDIDSTDEKIDYEIAYEWRHQLTWIFYFEHRKKPEDKIIVRENFYIEWIKKEAQINFEIKKDSQYAPVIVSFDASRSQVKDENIVKFEWDYGDDETEITDSIVPGHKYGKPGDYEVKLTVTTESGKIYSTSKKLILQPKPQTIKITTSMKTAPIYQEIDFLSDKSEGQIASYFWDFWDWGTSTKANPSYQYIKPGTYEVKLRLDFTNNNVREDKVEIVITDD